MIYINDRLDVVGINSYTYEYSQLSTQRKELVSRYQRFEDQVNCVFSYRLLQKGLRLEYGILSSPIFEYTEFGKPYLLQYPDIHFNISHCSMVAVCALSNRPIGVDVETIRKVSDVFLDYCCNDNELDMIHNSNNPFLQFAIIWTQKESFLKLIGKGLVNDLRNVLTENIINKISFNTMINDDKGYVCTTCSYKNG